MTNSPRQRAKITAATKEAKALIKALDSDECPHSADMLAEMTGIERSEVAYLVNNLAHLRERKLRNYTRRHTMLCKRVLNVLARSHYAQANF